MGSMTRVKVDRTKSVEAAAATWGSCGADQIGFFVGSKAAADPRNAATLKGIALRVAEMSGAIGMRPPEGKLTVIKFRPGANLLLEAKDYALSHEWTDAPVDEAALAIVFGRDVFLRLAIVDITTRGTPAAGHAHPERVAPDRISLLDAAEAALE
jgi:hypothetical protein